MTSTGELLDRPSAVRLEPAYDDTAAVLEVIRGASPFWAIASYGASEAEIKALSNDGRSSIFVPPWFRRDFALHGQDHRPLTDFSFAEVLSRTSGGKAELEDLVGREVRWLRPPYGRQS